MGGIGDSTGDPVGVPMEGPEDARNHDGNEGMEDKELFGHGIGPTALTGPRAQRRRRHVDGGHFPTLSPGSLSEIS